METMEKMEIETAIASFLPVGSSTEFAMDDLMHMKVGTIISGLLIVRGVFGDDTPEYLEGEILVRDNGIEFTETD